MAPNRRETGNIGEQAVAEFLERNGYAILERNYTVRGGEIDIIARKDGVLCFVEVKTRSEGAMVSGEMAITEKKRRFIIRAAGIYLRNYVKTHGETRCRFDVASVIISGGQVKSARYYKAAFNLSGKT